MPHSGISRIVYVGGILVLIIVDVFIIRGLLRYKSDRLYHFPNVGDIVDPTFVKTNLGTRIRCPFENVAATVIYHMSDTVNAKGELGMLELISQSSLGPDISIVVVSDSDAWPSEVTISSDIGIHFLRNGNSVFRRLNITVPRGYVIVFHQEKVVYSGIVNKRYLPSQLWDLQEQTKGARKSILPSIGDRVYGTFSNHGNIVYVDDIPADVPILLLSSLCTTCGENIIVTDIARLQGVFPLLVLPNIYNAQDLDRYIEHVGADTSYYNYYQLDLSSSNLNEDTFLQSFPVILILHDGKITYMSDASYTHEIILRDINNHIKGLR